jgi:hypothetical protein
LMPAWIAVRSSFFASAMLPASPNTKGRGGGGGGGGEQEGVGALLGRVHAPPPNALAP